MARLVVVDDSMIARQNLKSILQDLGHEIIAEGANGLEGYDLYIQNKPDLIFLDVTMPVLNGIECLKKIRAQCPDVKAIFVTSVDKSKTQMEAIELGALGYLSKPFTRSVVQAAIRVASL